MEPIFIIGISPRSGTNYLFNLLALHPDCVKSRHHGEDFILRHSTKYLDYIHGVTNNWVKEWGNDPQSFRDGLRHGLLKYLTPVDCTAKFVVTKTPHPENAGNFFQIFDSGYLILIIRNGQDLSESFYRSFKGRFDDAVRGYRNGAREILKILKDQQLMSTGRAFCVKYEELYQSNEKVMRNLMESMHLDPDQFDFKKSAELDVIGSSSIKDHQDKLTWDPVKKDATFNPLSRSQHWTRWQHYRFNWLAGKEARLLGYELQYSGKGVAYFTYNLAAMVYDFSFRTIRRLLIDLGL